LVALKGTFGNLKPVASAFAALGLAYILSGLRWFLVRGLGISIRLRPCAETFAIGAFANNFMLGSTGGGRIAFQATR
jgi:hypothetical protein